MPCPFLSSKDFNMYKDRNNRNFFSFLAVVFLSVLLLCILTPPTFSDDVAYRCVFQYDDNAPVRPVRSIYDIVESQTVHYDTVNGRIVVHSLVQFFLCFVDRGFLCFLNALFFTILIYTCSVSVSRCYRTLNATLLTFLLFVVIRGFQGAVLWSVGCFNYLWSLCFTVLFVAFLYRIRSFSIASWCVIASPLALLAGCSHEALSLPVSITFMLYMLLNRRNVFRSALFPFFIFFICGTALCLMSPGIRARATEVMSVSGLLKSAAVNMIFNIRIGWILIIVMMFMWRSRHNVFLSHLRKYMYVYFCAAVSFGIVLLCGTNLDRVAFHADFMASLLLVSLLTESSIYEYCKSIAKVLWAVMAVVFVPALYLNYVNSADYKNIEDNVKNKDTYVVKVKSASEGGVVADILRGRYIMDSVEFDFFCYYKAFDKDDYNMRCVAALYGRDSVMFLPENMATCAETGASAYGEYVADAAGKLYMRRMSTDRSVSDVVFHLKEEPAEIPVYKRIMSYAGDEYHLDKSRFKIVNMYGGKYLILTCPTTNISRRIRSIECR